MSASPSFTALTWNVHSCIGTDRRFAPARVARVLAEQHADVVALQEVGWHRRGHRDLDQFAFLEQETGYRVHQGPVRNHIRAHFGNALLTRAPVSRLQLIDLTVPYRAPRGAIDADIELPDLPLRVLVVHLGLDPWERKVQVDRLLTALALRPIRHTLMMGDFNEWRLMSPALENLEAVLPQVLRPRTFHSRRPVLRLDRMYASADLAFADYEVVHAAIARRASDHLPVRGTLVPR